MSDRSAGTSATSTPLMRAVYGKLIVATGGPVVAHYEHKVTSRSARFPAALDRYLDTTEWLSDSLSTEQLVHRDAVKRGALCFFPASADRVQYMLAARLRPRPERGEGQPGRTYTQLNLFAFDTQDWQQHAPQLVLTAYRWLLAEPDLQQDTEKHKRLQEIAAGIEHYRRTPLPIGEQPLPDDGSLLTHWFRLTESGKPCLVSGEADLSSQPFHRQEAHYLARLARLYYLLPPHDRVLLSASCGFAERNDQFSLQWVPGLTTQCPADRGSAETLIAEWRQVHGLKTFADWSALSTKKANPAGNFGYRDTDGSTLPAEARQRLRANLETYKGETALNTLVAYLAGERPAPAPGTTTNRDYRRQVLVGIAATLIFGDRRRTPFLVRTLALLDLTKYDPQGWTQVWAELIAGVPPDDVGAAPMNEAVGSALAVLRAEFGLKREKIPLDIPMDSWRPIQATLRYLAPLNPDPDADPAAAAIRDFKQLAAIEDWMRFYRQTLPGTTKPQSWWPDKLESRAYARRLLEFLEQAGTTLIDHPDQVTIIHHRLPAVFRMLVEPGHRDPGTQRKIQALRQTLADIQHAGQAQRSSSGRDKAMAARQIANSYFEPLKSDSPDNRAVRLAAHFVAAERRAPGGTGVRFWADGTLAVMDAELHHWQNRPSSASTAERSRWIDAFFRRLSQLFNLSRPAQSEGAAPPFEEELLRFVHSDDDPHAEIDAILSVILGIEPFQSDLYRGHKVLANRLVTCIGGPTVDIGRVIEAERFREALSWKLIAKDNTEAVGELVLTTLEALARTGLAARWSALRLVERFESTPGLYESLSDQRNHRSERLRAILVEMLLSWSECDSPWLHPGGNPSISKPSHPIRHFLAMELRYPYCQYFGRLANTRNQSGIRLNNQGLLDQALSAKHPAPQTLLDKKDFRYTRLIAKCAIAEWVRDYWLAQPGQRDDFGREWNQPSLFELEANPFPVTAHALEAVIAVIANAPDAAAESFTRIASATSPKAPKSDFGWSIVWALGFLTRFCDKIKPLDARCPQSLADLLLHPGDLVEIHFSIYLCRHILSLSIGPGECVLQKMSDPGRATETFNRCVLGRPANGWSNFLDIDDDKVEELLLRLMFLLALIEPCSASKGPGRRAVPSDFLASMVLTGPPADRIIRYLSGRKRRQLQFREALTGSFGQVFPHPTDLDRKGIAARDSIWKSWRLKV